MLIGLHGKAGSGKDTVYGYIAEWAEENEREARRDAFADRLKISAARALGFKEDEIDWMNLLKQDGANIVVRLPDNQHGWYDRQEITGREYLQYYGTEAHRDVFDSEFWVNAVLPKDGGTPVTDDILVITDVRFPNEAERIRDLGGQIWHILREDSGAGDHASEQPLEDSLVDVLVINSDTLQTLREMTYDLCDLYVGDLCGEGVRP